MTKWCDFLETAIKVSLTWLISQTLEDKLSVNYSFYSDQTHKGIVMSDINPKTEITQVWALVKFF